MDSTALTAVTVADVVTGNQHRELGDNMGDSMGDSIGQAVFVGILFLLRIFYEFFANQCAVEEDAMSLSMGKKGGKGSDSVESDGGKKGRRALEAVDTAAVNKERQLGMDDGLSPSDFLDFFLTFDFDDAQAVLEFVCFLFGVVINTIAEICPNIGPCVEFQGHTMTTDTGGPFLCGLECVGFGVVTNKAFVGGQFNSDTGECTCYEGCSRYEVFEFPPFAPGPIIAIGIISCSFLADEITINGTSTAGVEGAATSMDQGTYIDMVTNAIADRDAVARRRLREAEEQS